MSRSRVTFVRIDAAAIYSTLASPRRVCVETDPFASQVRVDQGDAGTIAALDAHDTHFSFGENIGFDGSDVPVSRHDWLPTRQPVVMDL